MSVGHSHVLRLSFGKMGLSIYYLEAGIVLQLDMLLNLVRLFTNFATLLIFLNSCSYCEVIQEEKRMFLSVSSYW